MKLNNIPNILKDFMNYLQINNYSEGTINKYKDDLMCFFYFIKFYKKIKIEVINFSSIILLRVKRKDIEAFMIFLNYTKNNISSTRYSKSCAIKCFYKWLTRDLPYNENPAENIVFRSSIVRIPKYLTLQEAKKIQTIFNNSNSKNYIRNNCIIILFLSTGIRRSELINIKLSDINFKDKSIIIRKGKGNKTRKVYFSEYCKKELLNYLHLKNIKYINLESYLFTKNNNSEKLGVGAIREICSKAYKLAGLENKHFTPHSLRHTSATIMYEQTRDILLVKEFLGHKTLNSTQIYTHTNSDIVREAVERNPLSNFIPSENKIA